MICERNKMKENYQLKLDNIIKNLSERPRLLLHSCCAPCSSYCMEYLTEHFDVTVFYCNPNISPEEEYRRRVSEQKRLISEMPLKSAVAFIEGEYIPQEFYDIAKGHESDSECGERCFLCYRLRLEKAAKLAAEMGFDYFTTTLSISPHKNAEKLNEIAAELSEIYSVKNLPSDFKKRGGYKRSIELSHEYELYRQDYCGCIFSKNEAEERRRKATNIDK